VSRRAVILAGGLGTRLRPYTVVLPKPLMPIGDFPILEVVLRQLAQQGFDRVTIAVNHQASLISAFCGDGSQWGIELDTSLEDEPLGTMGPLRLIPDLPDHFLVMNGDVLTDLDFAAFHDAHVARQDRFTISSYSRTQQIDYGVLKVDDGQRLVGFDEKPELKVAVSMGVYMVSKAALGHLPDQGPFGFDQLMRAMIADGDPVRVAPFDGYWLDIGRPDDYLQAIDEFAALKQRFLRG
jgi:NDP-sugar pyrophosphorylase family protein